MLVWAPDVDALRPPAVDAPFGGHEVQIEMTARYLAELEGISVRVCRHERPEWDGIDIVHGLGLTTAHVREARWRRLPVCLSVIHWSKAYRTGLLSARSPWEAFSSRARATGALAVAAMRGKAIEKAGQFAKWVTDTTALYEAVDLLLPNSQLEADQIVEDLGVTTQIRVVPNAADPSLFVDGSGWADRQGVVYVGRLEPHKNQLRLIRALRGTGIPLTIVGGDHPHHPSYGAEVRREAGGTVRVVGAIPHKELAAYYGMARVHAVPSGFETTGLVSLEAALCGCNIVTTEVGYAREYFEDMAWYCNPYDLKSIRAAVTAALSEPPQTRLREHILNRYTWEHTAAATAAAYRDALAPCPID